MKTMKAGKYYIGDLCYVMESDWAEFCKLTIKGDEVLDGMFKLKDGTEFATYHTYYGDGVYTTNYNDELGIDAGLIGCIRVSDVKDKTLLHLGTVVDFNSSFDTASQDGVIMFGDITIDTKQTEVED